jgi:hypothetical protein
VGRVPAVVMVLAFAPGAAPAGGPWRAAPEYVPLFAPAGTRREAYTAYVSPRGLDELLRQLRDAPGLLRSPGAWQPQPLLPADAFGQTGRYDRWKLAQLYGSRRAMVARGPAATEGGAEAWTLVSPYPDPTLQRLEPGTLLLVLSWGRHPTS